MKLSSYLFIIFVTLSLDNLSAHRDFWISRNYGNVKVRVTTGFFYEEINKAFIIGQLAEKLSKDLNYTKPIFLDFQHNYIDYCNPIYFLSYDKGKYEYKKGFSSKKRELLDKKSIVIRQIAQQFNVQYTLRILEYSIKNISTLKSLQKQIRNRQYFANCKVNSIDSTFINKALQISNSIEINNILKQKIVKPDDDLKNGISYYWQENKFYLFLRRQNKPDTILTSFENIYFYRNIDATTAILFDSDSSFFYFNKYNLPIVSRRQIIENTNSIYEPYKIETIGGNKLFISFWPNNNSIETEYKERILVYMTKKDVLFQDLDMLLK